MGCGRRLFVVYGRKRVTTATARSPASSPASTRLFSVSATRWSMKSQYAPPTSRMFGWRTITRPPGRRRRRATRSCSTTASRVGQVLEVVAHEDRAEGARRQDGPQLQPARAHEVDVCGKLRADVAQVGRPALGRPDVADEVAAVAGDVEHRRGRVDPALEVVDDLRPDPLLVARSDSAGKRRS